MAYNGIYRAKVVERSDERQRGGIRVTVPSIMGNSGKSQWVDLCMNCAYDEGGDIAIPKIGDTCWVMFEEGDINRPVYMGNFFSKAKTPLPNYDEDTRVISWDSCRIEMKGETMKFIVGEKTLITINGNSVSIQIGENQEGQKERESENSGDDGKTSKVILNGETLTFDIAGQSTMTFSESDILLKSNHIGLND